MTSPTDNQPNSEVALLLTRIKDEFTKITIRKWGYFFPIQVATWRFMAQARPGVLGDFTAGYDTEPYFEGRGAEWFVHALLWMNEKESA